MQELGPHTNTCEGICGVSHAQSGKYRCKAKHQGGKRCSAAGSHRSHGCHCTAKPYVSIEEDWFGARHAAETWQSSALFSRVCDGFPFNLCENWIYGIGVRAVWTWPIKLEESYFSLQQATFNSSAGCLFAVTRQKFSLCCLRPFYSFLWQRGVVWSTVPVML